MKRFLAILGAAMLGLVFIAPPASSAPPTEAKVSIRASVDRECNATVHVSWVRFDPVNTVYVLAYKSGSGAYAQYMDTAYATRGKVTVKFTADVQPAPVATVFSVYLNGTQAMKEITKDVACDNWTLVPTP